MSPPNPPTDADPTSADAHWHTAIDSPIGPLGLVATDEGLRAVSWRGEETSVKLPEEMTEDPGHPILRQAARQLAEYFDGDRTSFDLPLDLRGTPFQVTAWRALGDIPYGSTRSYGEQAALIGRPKAVRAVGQANGRNPVPVVLPCHRVIGADGSLTGFGGGLDLKTQLLEHEGALE
ncbi:methylated-DNA--[protein]-cysteine S-methyltransferase [Candidatus Poriferisodalis sp.]|uniref:methylated-DNA--[protein]-cysteine S-methyltransferase n=1 Tax=Candidatus Poriferisodalis sp. TaxID=3101277 RepID=UPI003B0187B7